MPLFTVPESELQQEYIPLPSGQYDADFVGAQLASNDNGWQAIAADFTNFATVAGASEVQVTFKGKTFALPIASRQKTARYTTQSTSQQAMDIGKGEIVRLAVALGVETRDENGNVSAPGETPEETVEALNQAAGTRVRLSIKQQPRKRNKVVQMKDDGTPILDDEIKRVFQPNK
jgi:hypothetical protein